MTGDHAWSDGVHSLHRARFARDTGRFTLGAEVARVNRIRRRDGLPISEHIARVAAELFYQRGINVVGVDLIADRAEVSKRTVYRHFATKDELIAASLVHGPFIGFPKGGTPRDRLLGAFDALIRFVADPTYRGCPYINAAAELTSPKHPARVIVQERTERRRRWFKRRLDEMRLDDTELLAEELDVLFDGALANATKRQTPTPAVAARAAVEVLIARATDASAELRSLAQAVPG